MTLPHHSRRDVRRADVWPHVRDDLCASLDMTTRAIAYAWPWRIVAAALVAISRTGLPVLLAFLVFSRNPPILPLMLMRAFTILVAVPAVAAWIIERVFAARVEIDADTLVLQLHGRRVEVPTSAVARVRPWTVPLPGSGVSLRLSSGRRLRYGLQLPDPSRLLSALPCAAGDGARMNESTVDGEHTTPRHPSVAYAHAKHAGAVRRWWHPIAQYPLFALVPTLPLFRVHQWIAYGGTWGEWHLLGRASYLRTFALYWATLTIYLMLYAGLLRGIAEMVALAAAWAAPTRAARVRRAVERGYRALYYGGVPVFVIIRLLPW